MTRDAYNSNRPGSEWIIRGFRWGFALAVCLAAPSVLHGEKKSPASAESPATGANVTVGIEGTYYARSPRALHARGFEENSPILLRIADVTQDGDALIHEIRYIGFYPGEYDLRDWLMHADGAAVSEISPLTVIVTSVLPQEHDGELADLARPPGPWVWPYRALMVMLACVWVLPLAWVAVRGLFRRRPAPPEESSAGPTLADQLAPLVAAILNHRGDAHQQAQLERLLLAYWRQRLDLDDCSTAEAIGAMRNDPRAGALLRQLEAWLYMPAGEAQVDVAGLLSPYRHAEMIEPASPPQPTEVVA